MDAESENSEPETDLPATIDAAARWVAARSVYEAEPTPEHEAADREAASAYLELRPGSSFANAQDLAAIGQMFATVIARQTQSHAQPQIPEIASVLGASHPLIVETADGRKVIQQTFTNNAGSRLQGIWKADDAQRYGQDLQRAARQVLTTELATPKLVVPGSGAR